MSKEANTTTGRKTTTLNGVKFDGVGLVTATREGTGNGEKLGDVVALRIVKGERRELRPLADILKGATDLIAGTVFERYTRGVYKERAKALKAAEEFARKIDVDLLPLELEEFAALPEDEPKKSDKPKTVKKGLVARMSELVDNTPVAEAINALAAVAEGHAPDGSLMAVLAAALRESAQHPEITTAEIERAIRGGKGIADALSRAIADRLRFGKPKA